MNNSNSSNSKQISSNPKGIVRRSLGCLALAALVVLPACGDDNEGSASGDEAVTVADGWSREPAEGQTRSAAYGVVTNAGDSDVTIVSASAPVSDRVELHETLMGDDGTMAMQEREGGFVVPAGGTFTFEPGGPHVMLFDVDPATYPESFDVTLTLDSGDTVTFTAEVRALDGGSMEDMDGTDDMDGMDHGGDMTDTTDMGG